MGFGQATRGWEDPARRLSDWATRDGSDLGEAIRSVLVEKSSTKTPPTRRAPVAALVMECVLHRAGGMDLIDPLFQRTLILVCKERGLPVVLDEVFAGIWRLGAEGAWEPSAMAAPRISPATPSYSPEGLVPLAITASTENVFDAFRGPTKTHALLHGHSYTAYPVGCAVAAEAMQNISRPGGEPELDRRGRRAGRW